MTDITGRRGEQLRALIRSARKDPGRWGPDHPRGLSQQELATMIGRSQVWVRQIENAYVPSVPANTLASICYALHIDPVYVRALGYSDVADAMDAAIMLREEEIPDYVIDMSPSAEEHLRRTPGLDNDQRELLVDTLRQMGRTEPLGQEIWTRRSARRRKGRAS